MSAPVTEPAARPDPVSAGWRGPILPINTESGDGRVYLLNDDADLDVRPLPLPLCAQDEIAEGHDGGRVVGRIDRVWVQDGAVWGEGTFDLADANAAEWARRLDEGFAGWVSADMDRTQYTQIPRDIDGNEVDPTDVASGAVAEGTPLLQISRWRIMGATLVSGPAFAEAKIAPADVGAAVEPVTAALTAAGVVYTAADFADPQLDGPTALTVTPDGKVFGHLAIFGTCHIGYAGSCVTPPHSASAYKYFHQGVVATDAGDLPVGKLTLGTGHAGLGDDATSAAAHYDHSGTVTAVVRAGEDEHGIWLCGRILPGLDDERITEMRRCGVSGDWRSIGGALELVAALCVNVPGFPVPRTESLAAGGQLALVAAGVVANRAEGGTRAPCSSTATMQASVSGSGDHDADGMIALLPTAHDAARLAAAGGEPADELHCTIAYYPDADQMPSPVEVADFITATYHGPVEAVISGTATFDSDNPCSVYLVQADGLAGLHDHFAPAGGTFDAYVPHITIRYSGDVGLDAAGTVTFDRIRISVRGEHTDIPLDQASLVAALDARVFGPELAVLDARMNAARLDQLDRRMGPMRLARLDQRMSAAYDPGQRRNPPGSPGGGKWVGKHGMSSPSGGDAESAAGPHVPGDAPDGWKEVADALKNAERIEIAPPDRQEYSGADQTTPALVQQHDLASPISDPLQHALRPSDGSDPDVNAARAAAALISLGQDARTLKEINQIDGYKDGWTTSDLLLVDDATMVEVKGLTTASPGRIKEKVREGRRQARSVLIDSTRSDLSVEGAREAIERSVGSSDIGPYLDDLWILTAHGGVRWTRAQP
ncbi:MAG: hypothetical protein QM658_03145 [Gordonia sp. (in: high G+C Gram-positive bacteria)]